MMTASHVHPSWPLYTFSHQGAGRNDEFGPNEHSMSRFEQAYIMQQAPYIRNAYDTVDG